MKFNFPKELRYTKEHEWAKDEGEVVVMGITQYAVEQLGDIVLVELPKIGMKVAQGETLGTVESVKTVSDIYSPVSGFVEEVNTTLGDKPEILNQDPYGEGWIAKIKPLDKGELDSLLTAEDYEKLIKELEE